MMESERKLCGSLLYLSKSYIQPYSSIKESRGAKEHQTVVHLTPWDLVYPSVEYAQMGMLFPKPSIPLEIIISHLKTSLSRCLDHFFPVAGRLSTIYHDTMPPSLSILVDCNDQGVEFIVASAKDVTLSDIVSSTNVPLLLKYFFPLNDANSLDGHSIPLFSVQVTEILDGIFISHSCNHSIADATSGWHFTNSWSEISRTGNTEISSPPIFDPFFLDPCTLPIHLPFKDHQEFIRRPPRPENLVECFFNFSVSIISELKEKANTEMETNRISSHQALLAHVWKCVVRAWKLHNDQESSCFLSISNRSRINPPVPDAYFGNCASGFEAKALAGDMTSHGVGWLAYKLNEAGASFTDESIRNWLDSWIEHPFIIPPMSKPNSIYIMNSPRLNVFGNDFGWGRPIAVRSGRNNKVDGMITEFPGPEGDGSIGLQFCLVDHAMLSLLEDEEFTRTTHHANVSEHLGKKGARHFKCAL